MGFYQKRQWTEKPPLSLGRLAISKGLVGWWLFNEESGNTLHDISGNSNHGTLTNKPTWIPTKFGRGLDFDGVDDYVYASAIGVGTDASSEETMSVWMKPNDTSQVDSAVLGYLDDATFINQYGRGITYSNGSVYAMGEANNSNLALSATLNDTKWHHIVAVFSTDGKLYVDGVLESSGDISDTWSYYFGIGAGMSHEPAPGNYFNGAIDDARLYNRALSADEILQLYANPYADLAPRKVWVPSIVGSTTAEITGVDSLTESKIVAGGETIVTTLTGDTFDAALGADNAVTTAYINGLDSAQSEATGWDAVVKAGLTFADVTRTSDTVCTVTLPAFATYDITEQETITQTIPASALVTSSVDVVADNTFTVDVVSGFQAAWARNTNTLIGAGFRG